jgi:nucleotide-binding universal stress UspA family protein
LRKTQSQSVIKGKSRIFLPRDCERGISVGDIIPKTEKHDSPLYTVLVLARSMEPIVVAVDGSKHSVKVVDYAISLARPLGAKLLLVNVPPDLSIREGYEQYAKVERMNPATYYQEVSDNIPEDLSERIRNAKVSFETISGSGSVAKCVLDTAKTNHGSLVVVGMFGLHRVAKIRALGSSARRIIEKSDVPVTSVP